MTFLLFLQYLITAVVLVAVAAFLAFTAYIHYVHQKYSHIPSPKYSSFYQGHVQEFVKLRGLDKDANVMDIFFTWYHEVDSKLFVVFFFSRAIVMVLDPAANKEIIMQVRNNKPKRQSKVIGFVFGERFLGYGLVSVPDYDTWKPRRKMYDPVFSKSYLKGLLPSFNTCADVLLATIEAQADGCTEVPMKQHLSECTLYVISKVAFGTDFSKQWDDASLGLKRAKGSGKLTFLIANVLKGLVEMQGQPLFSILHPYKAEAYRETVRAIRTIGRDCIRRRIGQVENGEAVPNDILTHILGLASTKESVDIEDLVDDFATFYFAGQETTGNLLSFAIAVLHTHPDLLERVRSEVDEVLGTRKHVSEEDLEKLKFTEQVLMETLRLYPPAPMISKQLCSETVLGDLKVPTGTTVFMSNYLMGRIPEYFNDPETFNPSRFDPENEQPSSLVYFPFGLGHRACIGKQFAMMEAKIILAKLIQTFKFTLPENYRVEIAGRGTLQPKDDIPCKVLLREN